MQTLSDEEREIWHEWKVAGEAVMVRVARDLTDQASLSGPDFGVLSRLVDLGGGSLRQQQLADSMRWDKSRLSHQLTRMEARDLVRRDPGEARSVVVSISVAGRKALGIARPVHARAVRRHFLQHIGVQELEALRTVCRRVAASPADFSGVATFKGERPKKTRL